MTAQSQSTKRKLSLLHLAQELGNVACAGRVMGYHRDTLYEVHLAFHSGGAAALVVTRRGPRRTHPNRVAPTIEAKVLEYSLPAPPTVPRGCPTSCAWAGPRSRPRACAGCSCNTTWKPPTGT
jgi:hypothetical protein